MGCARKPYPPCTHCHQYGHHSNQCWWKFSKPHAAVHSSMADVASSSQIMTINRGVDSLMKLVTSGSSQAPNLASTSAPSITNLFMTTFHLASILTSLPIKISTSMASMVGTSKCFQNSSSISLDLYFFY